MVLRRIAHTARLAGWRSARGYYPRSRRHPVVRDLRDHGIAWAPDLIGDLFDELAADAADRIADAANAYWPTPFLAHLLPDELPRHHPAARIATLPELEEIAGSYLGVEPMLRTVNMWLTRPTDADVRRVSDTRLWHRDGDDLANLKLYVFVTTIGEDDGPFRYAPGTHPFGRLGHVWVPSTDGRADDDAVARIVPPDRWVTGTGEAGSVLIADTCGYHRQVPAVSGERVMLMVQYTSTRPNWPPVTTLV